MNSILHCHHAAERTSPPHATNQVALSLPFLWSHDTFMISLVSSAWVEPRGASVAQGHRIHQEQPRASEGV